jgi:hypothetical protein
MKVDGSRSSSGIYVYTRPFHIESNVRRLQTLMEEEIMDEQSGFRANRGTIDSLFTTSTGLQKRKEQNLETWVLFVDLVKAFDTAPRDALFVVL